MWKGHSIEEIKKYLHQIQQNTNSKFIICKKCTPPDINDILTLEQAAKGLKLDPRTVKRVAFELGGRRIGNRRTGSSCAQDHPVAFQLGQCIGVF